MFLFYSETKSSIFAQVYGRSNSTAHLDADSLVSRRLRGSKASAVGVTVVFRRVR